MRLLGERQVVVDCDVLQADGGTRTASICGGYLALHDALARLVATGTLTAHPLHSFCAAVSVGIVDGVARARPALRRGQPRRGGHERGDAPAGGRRRAAVRRGAGDGRGQGVHPAPSSTTCSNWRRRGLAEIVARQADTGGGPAATPMTELPPPHPGVCHGEPGQGGRAAVHPRCATSSCWPVPTGCPRWSRTPGRSSATPG